MSKFFGPPARGVEGLHDHRLRRRQRRDAPRRRFEDQLVTLAAGVAPVRHRRRPRRDRARRRRRRTADRPCAQSSNAACLNSGENTICRAHMYPGPLLQPLPERVAAVGRVDLVVGTGAGTNRRSRCRSRCRRDDRWCTTRCRSRRRRRCRRFRRRRCRPPRYPPSHPARRCRRLSCLPRTGRRCPGRRRYRCDRRCRPRRRRSRYGRRLPLDPPVSPLPPSWENGLHPETKTAATAAALRM